MATLKKMLKMTLKLCKLVTQNAYIKGISLKLHCG